jgi:hypothetical protein
MELELATVCELCAELVTEDDYLLIAEIGENDEILELPGGRAHVAYVDSPELRMVHDSCWQEARDTELQRFALAPFVHVVADA